MKWTIDWCRKFPQVQPQPPLSRYQGASRSAVLAHKTHPGVGARPGHRRHGKAHRSAEASHDAEAKTTTARGGKPWKMAKEVETMINHIYPYLPIFTNIYHILTHIYPYLPILTHIYPYLPIFTNIYHTWRIPYLQNNARSWNNTFFRRQSWLSPSPMNIVLSLLRQA